MAFDPATQKPHTEEEYNQVSDYESNQDPIASKAGSILFWLVVFAFCTGDLIFSFYPLPLWVLIPGIIIPAAVLFYLIKGYSIYSR